MINRFDERLIDFNGLHQQPAIDAYDYYLLMCYERFNQIVTGSTINKLFVDEPQPEQRVNQFLLENHNINDSSYNINILTYGKTLFYILRYIQFLLLNFRRNDERINFFIFCDIETYRVHMNNLQFILNALRAPEHHFAPEVNTGEIYNFKQFLALYPGDRFHQLSLNELTLFQSINIYYIASADPLMKGIGCKRAAINQFHYLICNSAYNSGINKDNYIIMQLDDNISGINNINRDCKKRVVDNIIQCPNRNLPKNATPDTLKNCSTTDGLYENNIMKIYKLLKDIMTDDDKYTNTLLCGIDKGAAVTQDDSNGDFINNTHSIYKLTLQRIHSLHKLKIFYNPFFTRFLEDLTFNAIIKGVSKGKGVDKPLTFMHRSYHLRFIHNEYSDNEDCFPQDVGGCYIINDAGIKNPVNIRATEPIYLMYILYLNLITNMGLLSISYNKLTSDAPIFVYNGVDYLYPSKGKYGKFHNILYLFYLSYRMDKILVLHQGRTDTNSEAYLSDDPTDNTKFLSHLINVLKFITIESVTDPLVKNKINIQINPNIVDNFNPATLRDDITYSVNSFYYYAPLILSAEYDSIITLNEIDTGIYQTMMNKCKQLTTELCKEKTNIKEDQPYKTLKLITYLHRTYTITIDQSGGHIESDNVLLNQSKKLMQLYANANYQLNAEIIKYYKHLYYRDLGLTTNIFINDNNNFIKSYIDIVHHQLI